MADVDVGEKHWIFSLARQMKLNQIKRKRIKPGLRQRYVLIYFIKLLSFSRIFQVYAPCIDSEHKLHQKKFDTQQPVGIEPGPPVHELAVIFTRSCSANYKITLNFAYNYFCSFGITLRYFTSLKLCNSFQFLQSSLKATSTSNIIKTNHYWHLHHLHLSACGRSNEQLSTPGITQENLGLTLPLYSLEKHQKQKRQNFGFTQHHYFLQ